jgi:hypothetical protein
MQSTSRACFEFCFHFNHSNEGIRGGEAGPSDGRQERNRKMVHLTNT